MNTQPYLDSLAQAQAAARAAQESLNINATLGGGAGGSGGGGGAGGAMAAAAAEADNLSVKLKTVAQSQDEFSRATQLATTTLDGENGTVSAQITGYDALGQRVRATATAKGELTEATLLAQAASEAEAGEWTAETAVMANQARLRQEIATADALLRAGKVEMAAAALAERAALVLDDDALEAMRLKEIGAAATAEESSLSWGRLTGSFNDHAGASFRLIGPLGLVAAGVAAVGGAALKEANDLQDATVRLENYGNTNATVGQQINDTLNHTFGSGTDSAKAFAEALAPVAGMLAVVEGGSVNLADTEKVAAAAQDLHVATGEKLNATTRALVETMRVFKLTADDSSLAENALYESSIKSGKSVADVATSYGLLRDTLGDLNPTIADVQALFDASAASGTTNTRAMNTLASALGALHSGTKDEYDALQKYQIYITDSNHNFLDLKTVLEEVALSIEHKSDADAAAELKALGAANAGKDEIDVLREIAIKMHDGTFETQNLTKAQDDAARQADTTKSAFAQLGAGIGDMFSGLGKYVQKEGNEFQAWLKEAAINIGHLLVSIGQFQNNLPNWARGIVFQNGDPGSGNALINAGNSLAGLGAPSSNTRGSTGGGGSGPANLTAEGQGNAATIVSTMYNAALQYGLSPQQAQAFAQATLYAPLYESGGTLLASATQPTGPQPAGVSGNGGAVGPFQFDPVGGHWALAQQLGLNPRDLNAQLTVLGRGGYINNALSAFVGAGGNGYGAARAAYGALEGVPAGATGDNPALYNQAGSIVAQLLQGGAPLSSYQERQATAGNTTAPSAPNTSGGPITPYIPPNSGFGNEPAPKPPTQAEIDSARAEAQNAQETLGQSITRIQTKEIEGSKQVTAQTITDDQTRLKSAQDAATAQAQVVQKLVDAETQLAQNGDVLGANELHKQVGVAQHDLNNMVSDVTTANATLTSDTSQRLANEKASADAERQINQDRMAQMKDAIESYKLVGLQIPDAWQTGLEKAGTAVDASYSQILALDRELAAGMDADGQTLTGDQIKNIQNQRTILEGQLTDKKDVYAQMVAAAQLMDQGTRELQKGQLEDAKADRALDLSDVQATNAEKLASTLATIDRENQAQQAQLATSAEVESIHAAMYGATADAATDGTARQNAIIQQNLALQTEAIQKNEASQLDAIRSSEEAKLKEYNATLLAQQEAMQTAAGEQLKITAYTDLAKADMDVTLAQIQMLALQEVAGTADATTQQQINDLAKHLALFPDYLTALSASSVAWENAGTSAAKGVTIAQNAITNLTQWATQAAATVTQSGQNSLAVLQAQAQAQTSALSADPKAQALQNQISQLKIIQEQNTLNELPVQQQTKELQDQNTILSDQITLLKDRLDSSAQYLALQRGIAQIDLQVAQAQLALFNAITDAQAAALSVAKEQAAVTTSQNNVTNAQATLQADRAVASSAYLTLQTTQKQDAVTKDQLSLQILQSITDTQARALAQDKEAAAVLQSQNAVLSAQLTLAEDTAKTTTAYLTLQTALQVRAVLQDQLKLDLAQQVNAALAGQIASTKAVLDNLTAQTSVLQAQLALNQAQNQASPQYQSLQATINQLQVQQAALGIAGIKNANLDREVTQLQAQLKLLDAQTTAQNTGLSQQIAQQTVQEDQVKLSQAQLTAQTQLSPSLAGQLASLEAQDAVLKDQQALMNDTFTLSTSALTRQVAIAKVQQDQLAVQTAQDSVITRSAAALQVQLDTLNRQDQIVSGMSTLLAAQNTLELDKLTRLQAQQRVQQDQANLTVTENSVITTTQAALQVQLDTLTRQNTQLTDQQKILTAENTLSTQNLTQQQAIAKVQTDQVNLANAQNTAQQDILGGVNATVASLQAQLSLEQQIHNQTLLTAQIPSPSTTGTGTLGAGGAGGAAGASGQYPGYLFDPVNKVFVGPQGQTIPLQQVQNHIQSQFPGTPTGPTGAPVPIGPGGVGTQYVGGPLNGFQVVNKFVVNVGGKTLTEEILSNLATGQSMEVTVA